MLTDVTLLSLLPVASFSIAAGGLIVNAILRTGPARQVLVAAAFIFFLIASSLLWWQHQQLDRRTQETADEIVAVIGNEKRTLDEIVADLRRPDTSLANAAIDFLLREERIGSESASVTDAGSGKSFRIRLYFVRSVS